MSNTDLFERPIYTVHKNGLFGLTTKASVTEKINKPIFDNLGEWDTSNVTDLSQMFTPRPGVYEQMQGVNTHVYENLTPERVREVIEEVFRERPVPTIIGGPETQRMFDQAFRDQLITGESSFYIGGADAANSDGMVTTSYINTRTGRTSTEDRRRLVANTLQRQLQQGEISVMDYLDLISQQE